MVHMYTSEKTSMETDILQNARLRVDTQSKWDFLAGVEHCFVALFLHTETPSRSLNSSGTLEVVQILKRS